MIRADDTRLMNGPLGLAGQRCLASLFFISGRKLDKARRDQGLELARALIAGHALHPTAGVTCPNGQVMVARCLALLVEPAVGLLREIWAAWRQHFWQMPATQPRIWST